MPYTNCAACGAKALVGATRCPRCQAPFVSYDMSGERVPTVTCANCGVQRPAAIGVCPNCLTTSAPRRATMTRGAVLAALAIAAMIGIGYFVSRQLGGTKAQVVSTPPAPDKQEQTVADSLASDTAQVAPDTINRHDAFSSLPPGVQETLQVKPTAVAKRAEPAPAPVAAPVTKAPLVAANTTKPVKVDSAMIPPKPSLPPSVAVPDTGRWEYYVATTWVRVRSAPKQGSEVLRMIDSAQKVRLGPSQLGWRAVRVGVDRGWVDPRLFKPAP